MAPSTRTDRIVVAFNAPIDPNMAGGSESSVLSVIRSFKEHDPGINLEILALPRHVREMEAVAGSHQHVTAWPYQAPVPMTAKINGRLGNLRKSLVAARPFFDIGIRTLRTIRARIRAPRRSVTDGLLKSLGVSTIHFGLPLRFETSIPYVYEPQDLQHRHYPGFFTKTELKWRERMYGGGCKGAHRVVCGTWWTKADIMRQYGVPSERIAVIPRTSVRARTPVSAPAEERIARDLGLPERYAFYPAMTFAHKNHLRLLEALALLRDRRGIRIPLVCSGRLHSPHTPKIEKALQTLKLRDQVRFIGSVDDETLTVVYRRAAFMVFPSLFEGLSQSLLEGLISGLPIVAAKQSSIPETVGRAGLLFDGLDVESIASALEEVSKHPERLAELAGRAPAEVERYSWKKAARIFSAVYRSAAGAPLTAEQEGLLAEATAAPKENI